MKGACGWGGGRENGVLMAEGKACKGPASELVRAVGKFLRSVPGWGTSVAVGRRPGAASLAPCASRSISLSRHWRRSGGVRARCVGIGPWRPRCPASAAGRPDPGRLCAIGDRPRIRGLLIRRHRTARNRSRVPDDDPTGTPTFGSACRSAPARRDCLTPSSFGRFDRHCPRRDHHPAADASFTGAVPER